MPLHLIRKDVTEIKCDAIVNPTNARLSPGGGIDSLIHAKAGEELAKACATLGILKFGEAKITPAFNLPCKFVIHTAGPIWKGGDFYEQELLLACYKNSLKLAVENGCESVAVPLISSGSNKYPKDKALKVAVETINAFLQSEELFVYLVVYDEQSYEFSKQLYGRVEKFIQDNYSDGTFCADEHIFANKHQAPRGLDSENERSSLDEDLELEDLPSKSQAPSPRARKRRPPQEGFSVMSFSAGPDWIRKNRSPIKDGFPFKKDLSDIENLLGDMDDTFAVTLLKLIDLKGITDLECYKRANVSKQTWYKILNEKSYKPSKNTVIAFAISLKLTFDETQRLLSTVGFTLSKSSKFDIIIEYFIRLGIYDIMEINETLFEFDQPCLGV